MAEQRDVSNDISGKITGAALQAHTINGGVHVHGVPSRQGTAGPGDSTEVSAFAQDLARALVDAAEAKKAEKAAAEERERRKSERRKLEETRKREEAEKKEKELRNKTCAAIFLVVLGALFAFYLLNSITEDRLVSGVLVVIGIPLVLLGWNSSDVEDSQ